ncbi:hypothetical protein FGG08_003676 [Glutinoglossum americanum]|uniref:Ubiquitin carboxyl-terminal hydrolase n=1 Tax=Glutinoglossum americanum TaxID=1670608 RepID=A0A9P8L3F5_9PEZI|nr:hypothetical protein FGG08_003676 [Glutinoglossum americanum]
MISCTDQLDQITQLYILSKAMDPSPHRLTIAHHRAISQRSTTQVLTYRRSYHRTLNSTTPTTNLWWYLLRIHRNNLAMHHITLNQLYHRLYTHAHMQTHHLQPQQHSLIQEQRHLSDVNPSIRLFLGYPSPKSLFHLELPGGDESEEYPNLMQGSEVTDLTARSESETPPTSQPPSEADSTHPTTPSSALPSSSPAGIPITSSSSTSTRTILTAIPLAPAVPHLPALPKQVPREPVPAVAVAPPKMPDPPSEPAAAQACHPSSSSAEPSTTSSTPDQTPNPASPPPKPTPKSWADLVRANTAKATTTGASGTRNDLTKTNGFDIPRANSLADVLSSFSVDGDNEGESKVSFLEPRGLVNTGNMCYMNSVLQILVFCVPLYGFLDRVGKRAAHSFKSDTPLIDAMIMFMREFPVIDSAVSVEQLKMRLKDNELEQFGEAFIPEYVYNAIRHLPRFSSLQRGHQQDAEEFLGFLLGGLHDECVQVMRNSSPPNSLSTSMSPASNPAPTNGHFSEAPVITVEDANGGWLEVGPKQKTTVTRSSGTITTESPITKIFGGKLLSELRVPGLKSSVTLEPYQPLQLDIQSPQVNNITDALKNLTRSEILHGDFNSPRGPGTTAMKQVFIETLPPVLILHLKRFQYNNTGGTQKIWKKVGYPLELEIPKEAFPPRKRGLSAQGRLPKYQLIGVVYHHGKNASGGHYTVDVRRQDGREWIRLDDTSIRRVRSEDIVEGGSEETPKASAVSLESHKRETFGNTNTFEQMGPVDGKEAGGDEGWRQVNGQSSGAASGGKKPWSGAVNGNSTTTSDAAKGKPNEMFSVKDNKVAYLLFYQKIKT